VCVCDPWASPGLPQAQPVQLQKIWGSLRAGQQRGPRGADDVKMGYPEGWGLIAAQAPGFLPVYPWSSQQEWSGWNPLLRPSQAT
jgi:hypothetical protein